MELADERGERARVVGLVEDSADEDAGRHADRDAPVGRLEGVPECVLGGQPRHPEPRGDEADRDAEHGRAREQFREPTLVHYTGPMPGAGT
ncbi:hypothetical protein LPA44_09155 [Halobacterium sp. KA-4]|uniref:hypothetical protein n=1 Tax=Halobacterium sp. KA-4 TaxID=2896367 RepID=UPI001E534AA6|nr:hypothetical protein [Halobacterium sp. KA-4]MCD2200064.1 hypothetical protein [Halobacterium sp. KA-4]